MRENKGGSNLKILKYLVKRDEYDVWREIVQEGKKNPDKKEKRTYLLEDRVRGPIQATTEQYCVYCSNFSDPNFKRRGYDGGSGYCRKWNGGIDIKASCVYGNTTQKRDPGC